MNWICPHCQNEVDYELEECPYCGYHEMEEDRP
jgi:RNA polymerase subunit RPABC4/transcription elongation factor Spt4